MKYNKCLIALMGLTMLISHLHAGDFKQAKGDVVIPSVVYSAGDFVGEVRASFVFHSERPCLVKRIKGKETVYWMNSRHLGRTYQMTPMRSLVGDLYDLTDIDKALEQTDSVFLFYTDEGEKNLESYTIPTLAYYYGYLLNGQCLFGNLKTHRLYSSFREFINSEFGGYDKFTESRIRNIQQAMTGVRYENLYYAGLSQDDAIGFLRNDYAFNKNRVEEIGEERIVGMFLRLIETKLVVSDYQKAAVKRILLGNHLDFSNTKLLGTAFLC